MSWQIQDGAKTCLSKEGRKKTQGKNNSVYNIQSILLYYNNRLEFLRFNTDKPEECCLLF